MSSITIFNDLNVGQKVKVKGKPSEDGVFVALEIKLESSKETLGEEAQIEGLIQGLDYQKKILRLLNHEFALPSDIEIKDSQRNFIGLQDLKARDYVKLKGSYSERRGFALEKIKVKDTMDFKTEELQGGINKIDWEKKTFEIVGFKVMMNEETVIDAQDMTLMTESLSKNIGESAKSPASTFIVASADTSHETEMSRFLLTIDELPFALQHNEAIVREVTPMNPITGINDLQVGQRVKIKGETREDGVFIAREIKLEISPEAVPDEARIEGLIQYIDCQKNVLRLLDHDFILSGGLEIRDLQRNSLGLQDLKVGNRVKLKGTASKRQGFVLEKINMKEITSFDLAKLEGDINKIDPEKNTLEAIGFTVTVDEKTIFL